MKNKNSFEELREFYESMRARPGMYYHPQDFEVQRVFIEGTLAMCPAGLYKEFHEWLGVTLKVECPRRQNYLIEDVFEGTLKSTFKNPNNLTKSDFLFEQILAFIHEKCQC